MLKLWAILTREQALINLLRVTTLSQVFSIACVEIGNKNVLHLKESYKSLKVTELEIQEQQKRNNKIIIKVRHQ